MMWEKFLVVHSRESIKARKNKSTNPLSSFEMMKLRPRGIKWPAQGDIAS